MPILSTPNARLRQAFSHIMAPATALGKNVLPRVAAKLDVAMVSEVTAINIAASQRHAVGRERIVPNAPTLTIDVMSRFDARHWVFPMMSES